MGSDIILRVIHIRKQAKEIIITWAKKTMKIRKIYQCMHKIK